MRAMRIAFVVVMAVALCGPVSLRAFGDEGALNPAEPKGVTPTKSSNTLPPKKRNSKPPLTSTDIGKP